MKNNLNEINAWRKKSVLTRVFIQSIIGIVFIIFLISCNSKEKDAWENAKSVNTSASYDVYLQQYPDGQFVAEAKSQKEEACWLETKKADTYDAYEKYLTDYAAGKYANEALKKKNELEAINNSGNTQVDDKTQKKIKTVLDNYYKNLFSESFDASNYFDDDVEQFIAMTNTTALKITTYIKDSYHKEFQDGNYIIEDDSYTFSKLDDGNIEVNFIEKGSAIRKSLNKTQHVRIKIKAVFNSQIKIVNWKEIQIFENKLE